MHPSCALSEFLIHKIHGHKKWFLYNEVLEYFGHASIDNLNSQTHLMVQKTSVLAQRNWSTLYLAATIPFHLLSNFLTLVLELGTDELFFDHHSVTATFSFLLDT